jgi:uracil-DNA glycosylase
MDILHLVKSLKTNWKNDQGFISIVEKHSSILNQQLKKEIETFTGVLEIYPPENLIFDAFNHFDIEDLKVVLIGQDPYIHKNEAMGLCFSVPNGTKCPPSLRNVFKELEQEYSITRTQTDLRDWADQGVLLLNKALTVREGTSMSHMKIWRTFIDEVLQYVASRCHNVVYMLWGRTAQEVVKYIDQNNNLVLMSIHPSPLAQTRGESFVGNNHFKLCNEYLQKHKKKEIVWV